MSAQEKALQIHPIVPDSVAHNTKVLTHLRALTSSLFGAGAGILGLEGYAGFAYYLIFSLFVSALIYVFRVVPGSAVAVAGASGTGKGKGEGEMGGRYFQTSYELWIGGLVEGLPGYTLTWILAGGLVRS